MKRVIVASKNPVKVNAAVVGFQRMFPDESFNVEGITVPSGVSDQPMGDDEILRGALNRVEAAAKAVPDADYWVGIEGGSEEIADGMTTFAWAIIRSSDGRIGKGKTGSFFLPEKVASLVRGGMELGEADNAVFGRQNSKETNGAVGLLTDDAIDRTAFNTEAVILALIPFKNQEFYA